MNTTSLWVLDIVLISVLLALAVSALHSRSLRQSVILFITFGLVVALVWARLEAPDVALAEAAIGSGLAGALLLAALRDRNDATSSATTESRITRPAWQRLVVGYAVVGLALSTAWAFLDAYAGASGERLAGLVRAHLDDSGVGNPVTAVLLNFRAHDTLLELAVLLVALLGIVALGPQRAMPRRAEPIVDTLIVVLVPLLTVTAGYLLWIGAKAPGGAFQAGALLAAAGVAMHLGGRVAPGLPQGIGLRLLAVGGVGMFVIVGVATMASGRLFLQYPSGWSPWLILLIEVFATLSIAIALLIAYRGGLSEAHPSSRGGDHA